MGMAATKDSPSAPALEPVYGHSDVNEPVLLHQGSARLRVDASTIKGNGRILLRWLPFPHLGYELTRPAEPSDAQALHADPRLAVSEASIEALGDSNPEWDLSEGMHSAHFNGFLKPYEDGAEQGADRVLFHLVNFVKYIGEPIYGDTADRFLALPRLRLYDKEWDITIDALPDAVAVHREVDRVRGYALTHVGQLRRRDGGEISRSAARRQLDALSCLLTFARGSHCPPILPVGFAGDKQVYRSWDGAMPDPYAPYFSWFPRGPYGNGTNLAGLFAGVNHRWKNPVWCGLLPRVMGLYARANSPRPVDIAIITAQVALESLAWAYLVEEKEAWSRGRFKGANFHSYLRALLQELCIPTTVPPDLTRLEEFRQGQRAQGDDSDLNDAPRVLARVRNDLVHASARTSARADADVRIDAWNLACQYIEMILLAIFGYEGSYLDRTDKSYRVRVVPWVSSTDGEESGGVGSVPIY